VFESGEELVQAAQHLVVTLLSVLNSLLADATNKVLFGEEIVYFGCTSDGHHGSSEDSSHENFLLL
jgi:hypothetical protein